MVESMEVDSASVPEETQDAEAATIDGKQTSKLTIYLYLKKRGIRYTHCISNGYVINQLKIKRFSIGIGGKR